MANMKLSTNFVKHNKWCYPSAPVMSFQCSFFVIPVPRHWDLAFIMQPLG
ncbi:hypothetical protein [Wolbachia endosymbiont (group A) of Anomoia purmunda]|nr:hypothetical protein [Wolbachia endosymbiont (group A) of Anomoia purmunda]